LHVKSDEGMDSDQDYDINFSLDYDLPKGSKIVLKFPEVYNNLDK